MSITTCSITIINQSNSPKRFLLFQDVPKPKNGPTGNVFWNVYQASPKIESGDDSKTRFEMDSQFFAIYGTASANDIGNVRVYTSNSKRVKLGPDGSVVALTADEKEEYPKWNDAFDKDKKTAAEGGFSIVTDDKFKFPNKNNIYIGVGAKDPDNPTSVIPIQTYAAEPSLNSQLFPHLKYYICTGEFKPGIIVDRSTIGNSLKVDFTGAQVTDAFFTVNANGQYTDERGINKRNGIKWEVAQPGNA
ncbi:MAG: hypothetical protein Q9195_007308 [Heterodermia aff. obscurata]